VQKRDGLLLRRSRGVVRGGLGKTEHGARNPVNCRALRVES
jgi:hypothetical protein